MAYLELDRVTKVFERPNGKVVHALSAVTLAVEEAQSLIIIGPSGSGKTTVLRLVAGLETPTSGIIRLAGEVVNELPAKKRDVAMVFQSAALYPHMSVYENIAFGLKVRGTPRGQIDELVRGAADTLGLTGTLEAKPMALSGGQRQRVAIARAIVRRPNLFLFDEPLANVDPTLRSQLRNELCRLLRELRTTMVYVTHDHIEALSLGGPIAVLRDGTIQQVADPVSLYARPANQFVAGFIGSPAMNFFVGVLTWRENRLAFLTEKGLCLHLDEVIAPGVKGYANRSVIFGLRPEHIVPRPDGVRHQNEPVLQGKLIAVQLVGPEFYLELQGNWGDTFVVRTSVTAEFRVGEEYAFAVNLSKVHFFDPDTGKAI